MKDNYYRQKKKSLSFILSKSYIFFSIVLVLITFLTYTFIVFNMDSVLKYDGIYELGTMYRENLRRGDYRSIPVTQELGKNSYFYIVDNRGRVVYGSKGKKNIRYSEKQIMLMPRIDEETYVGTSSGTKTVLHYDLGMENTYKRIVVLDKNNNVKYTNLKKFPDSLTDKDVKYLIGENEQGKTVKRTSFVTDKNKKYNMIIYGHVASFSKVKRLVKHMGEGLSLILLFYGIILTTFVFWIKRRINRPVSIVNHALQKMGSGKNLEKLQYEGILEFENICKSFNHMTEELERTKREKNNMISDISHDIKTPVTVIRGYAEALKNGLIPESQQAYYLETIYEKARVITELADTFHSFSKLEREDEAPELESMDLGEEIRTYLAGRYSELELRQVELDIRIPDEKIIIKGDKVYFKRIFENIISNSLKHNEGKEGLKIIIHVIFRRPYVDIYIGDNGIGINVEIARNIFEPFYMGDKSRNMPSSSGLGMSIVKKIVVKHRGTIDLIYPPDRGFSIEFKITFPVVDCSPQ